MTQLSYEAYLDHLRREAGLLLAAAQPDRLAAPVPSCPGWTVTDVVQHTADVYRHKVETMRRGARPPWPPPATGQPPLAGFDAALDELRRELTTRDPASYGAGWWPHDRTVFFWARRMAQETFVHRFDVELGAAGAIGEVDETLAVDGVDEVLCRFVAGDWTDEPVQDAAGKAVGVRTGGRLWRTVLEPSAVVTVSDPAYEAPYDATVGGSPRDVLLWLWGRGPLDPLQVDGDPEVVAAFRRRLAAATQ